MASVIPGLIPYFSRVFRAEVALRYHDIIEMRMLDTGGDANSRFASGDADSIENTGADRAVLFTVESQWPAGQMHYRDLFVANVANRIHMV